MELRILRYFLAVAQEKNITRAAEKLLVSQPTLSKQLSDFEKELGTKLFIRGHRQITLTSEGVYLKSKAEEIISLADKTSLNIKNDQIISGDLTIGAGESIGMKRIIDIMGNINQDYPDVKIHLISGMADEMETLLNQGNLDFAVFMGERDLNEYNYLQMPETDEWGLIMRKDSLLADNDFISPKDLLGKPLLISAQEISKSRFKNWWGNLGSKMNIMGTFTLVFNAELLVENGNAYMMSFNHLIDKTHQDKLTFRPLNPPMIEPITVVWKKNTVLSKVAQLFVKRLQASLHNEDL
ncbi:LysR family transcriptional regulator [Companilactobacillus alimentarius]|uniref:LysR family transcriptional regulator n=1 Tax=Companilactobacillus alimentarius DSM 20249 TaxID=1423720 RepID=A0A2K9HF53_9LACO|nr:LysR family transcriptional regulator [Companilactobacillus alimentarius]AUI71194.1 LysR family transcriptional regulator [Companilactobacillus alimentarius DSM 20249]MDT6951531.1 LysR family transcriptional regulator [Companilactobacillus alimentarius]